MSAATPAGCGCPDPLVVAVPGAPGAAGNNGSAGTDGTNGTNGVNAYTTTTQYLLIPHVGATVTVTVASSAWAAVGQNVFVSDGTNVANFNVTSASTGSLTLIYLGYPGDTGTGVTITTGAVVTPAGLQGVAATTPTATNSLNTGGSQQLTVPPAQALASTLTLAASAGKTYLLFALVSLDYVGATFTANQTITLSIQRTNNTLAALASATTKTAISGTAITYSIGRLLLLAIPYTTVGASDVIQPFVSITATPGAGSVQVIESSISALRLS